MSNDECETSEVTMLRPRMPILVLVCLLLAAVTAEAQQTGLAGSLPTRRMLDRYGLERAWWNQVRLNATREKVRYLTTDEQIACVQSTGGMVSVFDAETGRLLWAVQLGRKDQPSYPAVTNDDVVMVVVGTTLYALKKFSGHPLWNIRIPGHPSTSPAADDRNVYIGTLDGSVYAFELRKIKQLFDEQRLPEWSFQTILWRYQTSGEITTPPITSIQVEDVNSLGSERQVVNFASRDKSLYGVTASRRELLFQFEAEAAISAPLTHAAGYLFLARDDPSYKEGFLFLATEDSYLHCLNAQNGAVRWDKVFGLPLQKAARVLSGDLYLLPTRGGMHCLSADTGRQRWWRPRITKFLAATQDFLYVSDPVGNVVLLSRDNGGLIGALPLRQFSVRLENDRTDRLYMSTQSGLLVCIREKGREFPIYHMYPDRQPILPEFAPEAGDEKAEPPPAEPAEKTPAEKKPADNSN